MRRNHTLRNAGLIVSILFIAQTALSQTGPAGVGNATGINNQPENTLWLETTSLDFTHEQTVETWIDKSGNNHDANQAIPAKQPVFINTGSFNVSKPVIRFDRNNQQFLDFSGNTVEGSDYTVFVVAANRTGGNQWVMGGTNTGSDQNLHFGWNNNTQYKYHHYGNDYTGISLLSGQPGTGAESFGIMSLLNDKSRTDRYVFQNNQQLGHGADPADILWSGAGLGGYPNSNSYSNIDVAEVIFYRSALNDAQLQIVNQYLSIKYNIAIGNNLYTPEVAYSYDMAGIGEAANGQHSTASSAGMYLSALSGLSVGDYVFASHNNAQNSKIDFTSTNLPVDVQKRFNRIWTVKGINTPEATISFAIGEAVADGQYPANHENFVLLRRDNTSENFEIVKNANGITDGDKIFFNLTSSELQDGYYTLGTTNELQSPLEGRPGRTWYTLISGSWDNWEIWTLDPSGALPNNPGQYTPSTSPTSEADKVVILTGRTIEVINNNLNHTSIVIEGRLDLKQTTGHDFSQIRGTGRILLAADNFPAGDASHFSSKGQGEGTVVYYGGSYLLQTPREFFDVRIELDNPSSELTVRAHYTINGNLRISSGIVKINDDLSTEILNINVLGDVTVLENGKIKTGAGDTRNGYQIGGTLPEPYHSVFHQFSIHGNFTNHGQVRFTNQTAPVYNAFTTTGAVNVRFTGAANNEVNLYGQTDFYNLIIDKGSDKTYILSLYSENSEYFSLFGPNNVGRNTPTGYTSENPQVRKALWIKSGTFKLTGSIHIPSLSEGGVGGNGDYPIGQHARLWIAGNNVTVYSTAKDKDQIPNYDVPWIQSNSSNQALSVYGEFRITNGFFGTRNSAGFIFWSQANAQIKIDGGTVNVAQLRSSGTGGGVASYIQTGGIMTVRGDVTEQGEVSGGSPLFEINDATGVFNMSGGQILLHGRSGICSASTNGFYIPSAEGNYNVTGGKITIETSPNRDFEIGSTAPIWDLEIKRYGSSGQATIRLTNHLKVLNNLLIDNNALLDVRKDDTDYDVFAGKDFDLMEDGQYNARSNTTWFTGSQAGRIYARNNAASAPLVFHNLSILKDQSWDPTVFRPVTLGNTNRTTDPADEKNAAMEITGQLKIIRGELNTYRYKVLQRGNIEIIDGRILANATHPGRIVLNGNDLQTLKGAVSKQQEFGSLELDNARGAKLLNNIAVNDFYFTEGIMDLDIHNLLVNGQYNQEGLVFDENLMFHTAGNAGDGGLSITINTDGTYLFPLGSNNKGLYKYTPLVATFSDVTSGGTVTLNVDNRALPTLDLEKNVALRYSWRIRHAGFTSLPYIISYVFTCATEDYPGTPWGEKWRPGKVIDIERSNEDKSNLSGNNITFNEGFALEEGSYTAAEVGAFNGQLKIFYSRGSQGMKNWSNRGTWSYTGHNGGEVPNGVNDRPGPGDIVIIGYNPDVDNGYHWVRMDENNKEVAEIRFAGDGTTWNPRLYIDQGDKQNLGKVSGRGGLILRVSPLEIPTVIGDLGDLINNNNSDIMYHIMNNGHVVIPGNIEVFPNLRIEASGGSIDNRLLSFEEDILVRSNLTVDGNSTLVLHNGAYGNISVEGNTFIGGYQGGRIIFPATGPNKTLTIKGNLQLRTSTSENELAVLNNTPSAKEHRILLGGNFIQDEGSINLSNNTLNGNNVVLELFGNSGAEYTRTGGNIPDFYRIVMNKNAAGLVTFNFLDDFNLNGPTHGDYKAIELISGRLGLRNAAIDVTLTSGGADFKIPQGSELWLGNQATVKASGSNTGIWLDGKLTAGYGTNVLINQGTNNYIEYTASGNSTIEINGQNSTFLVGSQIRRSTLNEEGILNYRQTQSNATVIIGTDGNNIPENSRGVFEVLNAGSHFEMADNARLIIANAQNNPAFPAIYLSPATQSVGQGSILQVGNNHTAANQTIGLFSDIALENLLTDNSAHNNTRLKLWYKEITVNAAVTIAEGTSLDADGWNITLRGSLENNGLYIPAGNTTFFSSSNNQQISGETTFFNLVKDTPNVLGILSDITVDNFLMLEAGTFEDNGHTLNARGHVLMNLLHQHEAGGNGIQLIGEERQVLTGNGIFGKLSVNNIAGVTLPINNSFRIAHALQLENGILNIGSNLLVIEENAQIIEANAFSENNMIQTNISFTDAGIRKFFPQVIPGDGYIFTYPIGSEGKYTPVRFNIESMDAGGSIRVKAADERHPTISDNDVCPDINHTENVLDYHWILEANNVSGLSGNATMRFYTEDFRIDTDHYTLEDYITARLLYGSTEWNKFGTESFDYGNRRLTYDFANTDDAGISGDYTAGVEDPDCEGAIPNEVPAYITIKNGAWNDASVWDTYPEAGGSVPAGGPRGSIAYVMHDVSLPQNYANSYKTTINIGATLRIGSTFGHRLGLVFGKGKLQLERGNLPAGVYDDFMGPTGGTLEFTGSDSYDVMSEVTTVRNLIFSGTGLRRLPNLDFTVYENLTIQGDDEYLYLINEHDRIITINGDIIFNQGSFNAGIGNAKVVMNGTTRQKITGNKNFTNHNGFWNFEMDNPAGLTLESAVDIEAELSLKTGVIHTNATNILTVVNPSATAVSNFGTTAYISGPMQKQVNSESYFTFPVGKNIYYQPIGIENTTKSALWKAEFIPQNTYTELGEGLYNISINDLWLLEDVFDIHPQAVVTLHWGGNTGVVDGFEQDLVVAELDGSNIWQNRGNSEFAGNSLGGQLTSAGFISFSKKSFSIGSTSSNNPLPIELISFGVKPDNTQAVIEWATASEINNDFFTIERSSNGRDFEVIAVIDSRAPNGMSNQVLHYSTYDIQPLEGISYYRLKQTDFDGSFEYSDLELFNYLPSNEIAYQLMPNPNKGNRFMIALNGLKPYEPLQINIVNILGKQVYHNSLTASDQGSLASYIIPHGRLSSGVYMVTVAGQSGKHTSRMVVQ